MCEILFLASVLSWLLISVYHSLKWQLMIICLSGVLQDFINIFKSFEILG